MGNLDDFEPESLFRAGGQVDLDDDFLSVDNWRPELPVLLVVRAGERPVNLLAIRRINVQLAALGHEAG